MAFSQKVADDALVACARHCCICHKFCGLKIELHHIELEGEGGNNTFDNCIPLCFECHGDMRSYDHKHPKGRKYSEDELKRHRDNWYGSVARQGGKPIPAPDQSRSPTLAVKVFKSSEIDIVKKIGCPCLVVRLKNSGTEVLEFRSLTAWVEAPGIAAEMNASFGNRLGYVPPPSEHNKPEIVFVELLTSHRKARDGTFKLKSRRTIEFYFPVAFPGIATFLKHMQRPSGLQIQFEGEKSEDLVIGEGSISQHLKTLFEVHKHHRYPLKEGMQFRVRALSAAMPTGNAAGTTNEFPLPLDGSPVDTQSPIARCNLITGIFQAIWNNWVITKRLYYRIQPSSNVDNRSLEDLKKIRYLVSIGCTVADLSLGEVVGLFRLLADQLQQIKDARGNQKPSVQQTYTSVLRTDPTDEVIEKTLPNLTFSDSRGSFQIGLGREARN